jgi:hypothetical protein
MLSGAATSRPVSIQEARYNIRLATFGGKSDLLPACSVRVHLAGPKKAVPLETQRVCDEMT